MRYGVSDLVAYALLSADEMAGEEPQSYEKAINSKESQKWQAAMEAKMESLKKNETWVLVDRPLEKRIVGCRWLFQVKELEIALNLGIKLG